MKANRKFTQGEDEAVSPVIAVILMVAITVVLAATVYVWVSGFGAGGNQPAKTIAMTSAGPIDTSTYASDFAKSYVVSAAAPGMKYQDVKLTLEGTELAFDPTSCAATLAVASWGACAGTADRIASDVISAGDVIKLRTDTTMSGQSIRILDSQANSVILTLVAG